MAKVVTELRMDRNITFSNKTCVYCGKGIEKHELTKDHVIGRRFVPKGKLKHCWNLVVNACHECNHKKSVLEDDISAISLLGNLHCTGGELDKEVFDEIRRKSNGCTSKSTGLKVKDSHPKIEIKVPVKNEAMCTMNLTAQPSIDNQRIFSLARMQMIALFYFLTYDKESRIGNFWPIGFYPVFAIHRSDWGNPIHRAFMNAIKDWEYRWRGCGADDYFKSIIRKHPDFSCWAWALEWNRYYRVLGFFGEQEPSQSIVTSFPRPKAHTVLSSGSERLIVRLEEQLDEKDDILFNII